MSDQALIFLASSLILYVHFPLLVYPVEMENTCLIKMDVVVVHVGVVYLVDSISNGHYGSAYYPLCQKSRERALHLILSLYGVIKPMKLRRSVPNIAPFRSVVIARDEMRV